ncbi:MAG: O-antigen ligase family protein [Methylophilaceae bacterium]
MQTLANLQKILLMLIVLAYIALITLQPSLQLWPKHIVWFIDRQRLLELLLLGLVLLHILQTGHLTQNTILASKLIQSGLIVLAIFSFFSITLAYAPRHALTEFNMFVALGFLSLLIANQYQQRKNNLIKFFTYALWFSVLLYMLSFYTGYITATVVKKPLKWPFPFTGFTNIRSFNQYQLWGIGLLLLPLICYELKRTTRFFVHIALIAWWVLLFYSASRGVLVAWLIGATLTLLVYQKFSWSFLKLQAAYLISGFISYQILFKLIPKTHGSQLVTSTVVRETTHDRLELWNQAILMIKTYPIFGVGPMHYAWFNKTNGHPHNSILQIAAEWGLPATAIILSIAIHAFYCWFRKFSLNQLEAKSTLDKNLSVILFFTMITNAAYSMVDGVIVMPISQVLMFTMIGLMLGQYASTVNVAPHKSIFRPLIAGILLITLAWSTYPEIKQGFSADRKGFSMGHTAIGPRFWRETK